jgi:Zn-finger nucleic acid-binding protein/ribosomal protein L37E
MKCSNCSAEMNAMTMEAHLSAPVEIDMCSACQSFWFDKWEDMKLSPGSTLKLMKLIGENSSPRSAPYANVLPCPRCGSHLVFTHDLQGNTRFSYWRCVNDHGRFIGFLDFLREKSFIRNVSAQEINELKQKIQTVNCANCGAAINLTTDSVCTHCGSPISILDVKQPQQWVSELKQAPEPLKFDPALFKPEPADDDSSFNLVHAGLSAFARWLTKSGI